MESSAKSPKILDPQQLKIFAKIEWKRYTTVILCKKSLKDLDPLPPKNEGVSHIFGAPSFSCAAGPFEANSYKGPSCAASSWTIHYPVEEKRSGTARLLLPSVILVPGWVCGEGALLAWGSFLASHGFVAMTIGTKSPARDMPPHRAAALLAAAATLRRENDRHDAPVAGRVDMGRVAFMGYSLGGGGVLISAGAAAAAGDPFPKAVVALAPHAGIGIECPDFVKRHVETNSKVPVLIICGDEDKQAPHNAFSRPMYEGIPSGTPKMFFQVRGGDHGVVNGPAGTGTLQKFVPLLDCLACHLCALCCWPPCFQRCWALNRPVGKHTDVDATTAAATGSGAIGGVAVAWLKLFLNGDETQRAVLSEPRSSPTSASAFETNLNVVQSNDSREVKVVDLSEASC